jgi:hypothetical protein
MNPFQFRKALYFLSFFSSFGSLFVVALYKYFVLVNEKCLLLSLTHPTPARLSLATGVEMGFDIMGNSENVGSNIIFSSRRIFFAIYGKKATKVLCPFPSPHFILSLSLFPPFRKAQS